MRSDIDHLPPHKQRELERVVQIIFEEFEDALSLATQRNHLPTRRVPALPLRRHKPRQTDPARAPRPPSCPVLHFGFSLP